MNQISDAWRAGDEANKIRQRPCQGHAVQSHCSARTRLSRLEAGHSDCELQNFLYSRARPTRPGNNSVRPDFCQKFYSPARSGRAARPVQSSSLEAASLQLDPGSQLGQPMRGRGV